MHKQTLIDKEKENSKQDRGNLCCPMCESEHFLHNTNTHTRIHAHTQTHPLILSHSSGADRLVYQPGQYVPPRGEAVELMQKPISNGAINDIFVPS